MLTTDNHEPAPYNPSERVTAIEGLIKTAAEKYKQNDFTSVISSLDNHNPVAVKHNIDLSYENIPRIFMGDLTDPQHLPNVIVAILNNSRAPSHTTIDLPILDFYHNSWQEKIDPLGFPPLWKKVHALCLLEEWIHIKDQSIENETNIPPGTNDHENQAALYLHDKLGIKLPKYFLELYDRTDLKLPVEDHDFDDVEI